MNQTHLILSLVMLFAFILLSIALIKIRRRPTVQRQQPQLANFAAFDAEVEDILETDEFVSEPRVVQAPASTSTPAPAQQKPIGTIVSLHVFAKPHRYFGGYELLQVLESNQLRFGNMNIFHYSAADAASSEPIFSIAQATEPGTFDLEQMGGLQCQGLTLFRRQKGDEAIDREHYQTMLATAQALAEDLDGEVFTSQRQRLTDQ